MELPKMNGEYDIVRDGIQYKLIVGGDTWAYRIQRDGRDVHHTDYGSNIKEVLKDFSDKPLLKILGYSCLKSGDIITILNGQYKYSFTSDNAEVFIKTNKSSIDFYFTKKEIDRKNKLIEARIKSFKDFLGTQKSTIEETIDNLGELDESRDLFLSEVAKIYSENFELIVKEFKSPKIKSQIRNLFHKLTK